MSSLTVQERFLSANTISGMRTRIKVCGITRVEDARIAGRIGIDAIGLVFYPPSPRAIDLRRAIAISAALPPFVTLVALFVNPDKNLVKEVINALPIGQLQFHGDESPADCEQYQRPYIKAVRMREGVVLADWEQRFASASALLLDTHQEGIWGGTGKSFDWSLIPRNSDKPLILAGGLSPDNVQEAVKRVRPFAVDVSGGVETTKGVKDADKMVKFAALVSSDPDIAF